MGRKLDAVIASLPAAQQARIELLAQQKIDETLAHAKTLSDFRKAVGKTQAEVAAVLGVKQHAVSQLEQRSDTYVSTLQKFLESLGMKLELALVTSNGIKIELPNFHPWSEDVRSNPAVAQQTVARQRTAHTPTGKTSAKTGAAKGGVAAAKRG